MSTIYTDGAGNKYLGDCIWGNNDLNYTTISYLKAAPQTSGSFGTVFTSDMAGLLASLSYTATGSAPSGDINTDIWRGTPPISGALPFKWRTSTVSTHAGNAFYGTLISSGFSFSTGNNTAFAINTGHTYAAVANNRSVASMVFTTTPTNRTVYANQSMFRYTGLLQDVNTNYGYYSGDLLNHAVCIASNTGMNHAVDSNPPSSGVGSHYIGTAQKILLRTDRAIYDISCSDGQTPGAQWATDMWVYDDNDTLGYPVIGRVPNLLLGVGTYTYLKPVKIQGSVFPDGGSPWYLPVGIFAGKTLLMRCHSSMS